MSCVRWDVFLNCDVVQSVDGGQDNALTLARMYENGQAAVPQDWVSAYVLYAMADQHGIDAAKTHMHS